MRVLIVIVVLVAILGLFGWLRFSTPDGDPTIRVDSEKMKQDTSSIVEKSKRVADDAAKNIERAAKEVDDRIDLEPAVE